jgi:hypothetical protein
LLLLLFSGPQGRLAVECLLFFGYSVGWALCHLHVLFRVTVAVADILVVANVLALAVTSLSNCCYGNVIVAHL